MFCHITTHIDTDPYQDLLEEKGGNAFPYIVFMDAAGDVVMKYDLRTEEAWHTAGFVKAGDAVAKYFELLKKAPTGTTADKVHLLETQLDLGVLSYDDARSKLDALSKLDGFDKALTKAQLEVIEQKLTNLDFENFMDGLQQVRDRREAFTKAGEKIRAMRKAKRIPDGDTGLNFWNLLMYYAEQEKDRDLLEDAAKHFKALLDPKDRRQLQLIRATDQRLEKAKDW